MQKKFYYIIAAMPGQDVPADKDSPTNNYFSTKEKAIEAAKRRHAESRSKAGGTAYDYVVLESVTRTVSPVPEVDTKDFE